MQLPPGPAEPVTIYRQPEPPRRSRSRLALSILGWAFTVIVVCATGVAGGAYLYTHETVADVVAHSIDVKATAKKLDIPIAGQPATALVIGYDRRADEAKGAPSRSDTLMLIRADPAGKTISMLSFPRDLRAEIVCPGKATYTTKINAAYADCGSRGTLETVRKLTGVSVNYLITVNFRGFTQVVDKLGGMWIDVDRRYYNSPAGRPDTPRSTCSRGTRSSTAHRPSTSSASGTPIATSTATPGSRASFARSRIRCTRTCLLSSCRR